MYAVIRAGGKQLKVSEGSIVELEKQNVKPGDGVTFSEVLMVSDGNELDVGSPLVEKANVFGTVLDVFRSPKILVFKKKRRKQYRRTRGHRQYLMRVRIDEMGLYQERRKRPEEMTPAKRAVAVQVPGPAVEEKPAEVREVPAAKKEKRALKKPVPVAKKKLTKEKASAKKKESVKSKPGKGKGGKGKRK